MFTANVKEQTAFLFEKSITDGALETIYEVTVLILEFPNEVSAAVLLQ